MAEQQLTRARAYPGVLVEGVYAELTQLSRSPRLYVLDGFATGGECDAILASADETALSARGIAFNHDGTGFSFELPVESSGVAADLASRIERILGTDNAMRATLRFRRYAAGEAHPPHVDNFRIGPLDLIATALVCLTDVAQGGATGFPFSSPALAVPPRRGRLIAWLNNRTDGSPDPIAYHEGQAVWRGEKATITDFIYADPLDSRLVTQGPPGIA